MSGRDQILSAIRHSLGRGPVEGAARAALESRLAEHRPNLIPKRADLPHAEQVDLFCRMAEALAATVARVDRDADVPAAIADYLARANLPTELRLAPQPWLQNLPWDSRPLLTVRTGRADAADPISVTPAFVGIAETGTLMLASGAETPTTLNFLPDTHIVVLTAGQIVRAYEDGWQRLRDRHAGGNDWPRAVNFVSGPSRTADIEQELIMGAHGPRRLHIIVVDERAG